MSSLFQITELRLLIVRLLTGKDLKACTLVCNAWHQYFQQHIWRVLKAPDTTSPEHLAAWQEGVKKNAHWVHFIKRTKANGEIAKLEDHLLAHCRSLVSVEIPFNARKETWIALIKLSPELRQVDAQGMDRHTCSQLLDDPEEGRHNCPSKEAPTLFPTVLAILVACPSLDQLDVGSMKRQIKPGGRQAHGEKSLEIPTKTFGLRHLKISSHSDQAVVEELLLHLPDIERFELDSECRNLNLAKLFLEGLLPRVTKLDINSWYNPSKLLMAIPPRQLCSVSIFLDGRKDLCRLLTRQGPSLEVISLCYSTDFYDFFEMGEIFFKCPRLRQLKIDRCDGAGFVDIGNLLYKPWVCMDLEILVAPLGVYSRYDVHIPPELEEARVVNRAHKNPKKDRQLVEDLFLGRMSKLRKLREVGLVDVDDSFALSYATQVALGCVNLNREAP